MTKTGSRLTREIVGPAGSTRVGAFSGCIPEEPEEELCDSLLEEACAQAKTEPVRQRYNAADAATGTKGSEESRIKKSCLQVYLDAEAGSNGR
jgi:hypothetical protein